MSSEFLITLVICCFKEGDLLKECWESILNQTDNRWEAVLVMDGGADEKTKKIFNELTHPKLRKFTNRENMGPYKTLNKGCEQAKTIYYMPLDADDKLPPNSVKDVLDAFQKKQCDFVFGNVAFFGEKKKVVNFLYPPTKRDIYNHKNSKLSVKKKIWMALGGYSDELSDGYADFDFFISLLEKHYKCCHCNSVHYLYRWWSDNQVSKSYRLGYYRKRSIIVKRHPLFFKKAVFRFRFVGYGALLDAQGYSLMGEKKKARKFAIKALTLGCLDRPMAWYIMFFGKVNKNGKIYNFLKKLYETTLKRLLVRIDI